MQTSDSMISAAPRLPASNRQKTASNAFIRLLPRSALGPAAWGSGRVLFQSVEVAILTALYESFRHGLQFLPATANVLGLFLGDAIVRDRVGDDPEQVGEFLDDFVGCRDEEFGMRVVGFGIFDEETARPLADPLDQP